MKTEDKNRSFMIRSALLGIVFFMLLLPVKSQDKSNIFFPDSSLATTGIYYYPEHWPETQWERDIKNISAIRMAFMCIGGMGFMLP